MMAFDEIGNGTVIRAEFMYSNGSTKVRNCIVLTRMDKKVAIVPIPPSPIGKTLPSINFLIA